MRLICILVPDHSYFMNLKRFTKSFGDASRGVVYVFKHEQNFRIQLFLGFIVVVLMFVFGLSRQEMIVILLLILLVLILELLNSAIEKFVDLIKPRLHYQAEAVKDIMAAAVFFASLGSLLVGAIVFGPYIIDFIL